MRQDDSTVRKAEMASLIERLRAKKDSGRRALAGGSISSDGTVKMWGGQKSMVLVNPDGPAAADMIEKLATLESSPTEGALRAIPEGMVLVPREPTEPMLRSAARRLFCYDEGREIGESSLRYWIDSPDENDAAVARELREQATVAWSAMLSSFTPTETGEQGK